MRPIYQRTSGLQTTRNNNRHDCCLNAFQKPGKTSEPTKVCSKDFASYILIVRYNFKIAVLDVVC